MAIQPPPVESHVRFTQISNLLSRPLCCRYAFTEFKVLRLPIRNGEAVGYARWIWAVGLFEPDQWEVLGAWSGQTAPGQLAHDLHERGIEKIKAIAADGFADFASLYPDAAQWPPAEGSLDMHSTSTARALGRRRWTALQSAAATAERFHKRLTRTIERRAPFPDEVAAATFLAHALQKADRLLYAT